MWMAYLDGQVLHKPLTAATTLPFARLSMQLNSAPSFTFKLYRTHPLYEQAVSGVMSASVTVTRDGVQMFSGRIAAVEPNYITGLCTVTCEGDLARLNDTVCPPYDFSGSPREYLQLLLDAHNAQSPFKIRAGAVTVQDSNDYIVRSNESPARVLSELMSKTAKSSLGGYVEVYDEEGEHWCDWTAAPVASGDQNAEVGVNVLTLTGKMDGTGIVTAIYPVGAKSTENGVTAIVNIAELPDGSLGHGVSKRGAYVVNDALYARYGWIADVRQWSDVHYANILRDKAAAECAGLALAEELTVTAVDLADAGFDVDHFALGQPVTVRADGVTGETMVTAITYDLLKASGGSMKFGAAANTSSGRAAEAASSANAAANSAAWAQATATFGNRFFYRDEQDATDGSTIGRTITTGEAGGEFPAVILNDSTGGADLEGDTATVRGTTEAALRIATNSSASANVRVFYNNNTGKAFAQLGAGSAYIRINSDGTYEGFPANPYTLPPASGSVLGGVMVGDGLSVASSGLLSANVGTWSSVSVNTSPFPSGFSATRSVTVYKNDFLRLLYVMAIYDTDGTAVNVPANSVICVLNDRTLHGSSTLNVGYGLRYSSSGLADWTARYYPYSSNYPGIKTPTWAFTATSVKFQALLPYSALGL